MSISADRLVVARPRLFRSHVEQLFAQDAITTIEAVDSHWNGFLLGLAVSAGILATVPGACSGECQGVGALAGLAAGAAPFIGWGMDDMINTPVYERSSQRSGATLAPLIGRERFSVIARVSF